LLAARDCDDWLARTRSMFIEIHDSEAERVVMGAVARHGFTHTTYRELHVFHRRSR
jgi:hypothetical protein